MIPVRTSVPNVAVAVGLVFAMTSVACATHAFTNTNDHSIPTFSISDLREISSSIRQNENFDNNRIEEFRQSLSTTGLLAVSLDNDNYEHTSYMENRRVALDGLCSCIDHPSFLELEQTHELLLQQSQTLRKSVATATAGFDHPLPLPEGLDTACGSRVFDAMEGLRDEISSVSKAFVSALDGALVHDTNERTNHYGRPKTLLRDEHGKSYETITEIVRSANHLEHFHVYTNSDKNQQSELAWDWHTDAGLFLVFVPALDCNDNNHMDESFYYRGPDGTPIRAKFDGGRTAIVMLGQGAQDWLDLPSPEKGTSLKATTHSVRWSEISNTGSIQQQQRRAWYGMMHLVPETAMIYGAKTLKDVKESLSLSHQSKTKHKSPSQFLSPGISLGCGNIHSSLVHEDQQQLQSIDDVKIQSASRRQRHLSTQDPSMCNNVTNFFCWMTCMDIPQIDQAELYVEAGYSLYCVDESAMASSNNNVTKAHEPCVGIHNPACKGSWEKTVKGGPSAAINVQQGAEEDIEYPFCYGGTTMYMEGFHWIQSSTCVVLLFPSWVLNSASRYIAAVIGTILAAIGLEKFIQQRRKIMVSMEGGVHRLIVSALFYGVQLSIGYLLMLIIMIYSGALFFSVILGLVVGHVMFNAKDALWPIDDASQDGDEVGTVEENNSNTTPTIEATRKLPSATKHCRSSARSERMSFTESGEERAIREGSTHCQDFGGSFELDYYGSMENGNRNTQLNKSGTAPVDVIATKKKSISQNKARNSALDPGVPEGSTPCCQHGI